MDSFISINLININLNLLIALMHQADDTEIPVI